MPRYRILSRQVKGAAETVLFFPADLHNYMNIFDADRLANVDLIIGRVFFNITIFLQCYFEFILSFL